MDNQTVTIVLQFFGVVFIVLGAAGLLGIWKNWYWRSQRTIYGYIPFGLMFLLSAFEPQVRQQLGSAVWVLFVLYTLLFALGMVGFFRPPRFVKPKWVQPIEAQPASVYQVMRKQVKEGANWRQRVSSPEELDAWIKEIRRQKPKKGK
jgi:hypothetical protein